MVRALKDTHREPKYRTVRSKLLLVRLVKDCLPEEKPAYKKNRKK